MQGLLCRDTQTIPATAESGYFRKLMEAYVFGLLVWQKETTFYFDSPEEYIALNKQMVGTYLQHLRKRYGQDKIIVQKEPKLTIYFPEVMQLVDDAKFIVMVRDPRDAVSSEMRRLQKLCDMHQKKYVRDIKACIHTYLEAYNRLFENRDSLKERLLFIGYEELVRQPQKALHKIRGFTGLEMAIDTSGGWETTRAQELSSASPLDGQPISDSSIERYKDYLTDNELGVLMNVKDRINALFGFNVYCAEPAAPVERTQEPYGSEI
jgi:hypothetical protein